MSSMLVFLLLSVCQLTGSVHGSNHQKVIVKEDSDAVLPCSLVTKENINFKVFDWQKSAQKDEGRKEVFFYDAGLHYNNGRPGQSEQFKGRVSHFPDELKHGNASITIRDTKVTDSGNYTCVFPRVEPRQIFHIELVVERDLKDRSGEDKAAVPKLHLTVVDVRASGVLLQCHVSLVPPMANLEWRDSAGIVLHTEETLVSQREVTLQITVTKPDCFSCVVTQQDIGHVLHSEITVSEKLFRDECSGVSSGLLIGGAVAALFLGALIVLAALALLVSKKCITVRFNKASHQKENGEMPLHKNGLYKNPELENGSCCNEKVWYPDPFVLSLKEPDVW